jgi:hypothetical protein
MSGEQQQVEPRKGREGARWINQRPTSEEFATWARDNITIADGLEIEDYLGGIVLIPATEAKSKYVAGFDAKGEPLIVERPELVYVPYAKVETRLQYYWDLLALNEEKWIGVVEPITTERPELAMLAEVITDLPGEEEEIPAALQKREIFKPATIAAIVHQLPPGFFLMPVPIGDNYTYSLGCSYRVAIYRLGADADARPIREGRGTKQVALVTLGWGEQRGQKVPKVDENALMKAETGAIGRALGAAGIFTIPGSGIATAEDMIDAAAGGNAVPTDAPAEGAGPAAPAEAAAPRQQAQARTEEPTDEQVLEEVKGIVAALQEDFPEAYEAFGTWCNGRRPKITDLGSLKGPALRGVHIKLKKLAEDARARQEARGQEQAAAAPQDAPEPQQEPQAAEEAGGGPALV